MSQHTKDSQKEVKVEDLLRLKRAERPDDAFWGEFDKELHQRMLQTLVKKGPLHLQIWRTLSGRLTQSVGVACAAAFLALMVVRPVFIGTTSADLPVAQIDNSALTSTSVVEVAMSDLDVSSIEADHDYSIEGISPNVESSDERFTRDFGMEGFELAMDADYSSDEASMRPSFGSAGVATTLVY